MKKFLSLVLALVMTMSLVTVASAAEYKDDASINYDEAVAVISGAGIVNGYPDGTFNPKGTLTRQAAAKIICNLTLGSTAADALGTTVAPFKDVPANSEFGGYIAYCAQMQYISGYADGTFRPTATLTGFAFLKMLECALGYDQTIEGLVGTNWAVNVARLALEKELIDGNDAFVGSKAITREEACLYALNALEAETVAYASKGTNITTTDGTVVNVGATPAYDRGTAHTLAADCQKKLDLTNWTNDTFYGPSRTSTFDNVKIGTFSKKADKVYTEKVEGKDIWKDMSLNSNIDDYKYSEDGAAFATGTLTKTSEAEFGEDGALTYVYKVDFNGDGKNDGVVICTHFLYTDKITAVGKNTAGDRIVKIDGLEYKTEDFAKGDIVSYTKDVSEANDADKIQSMVALDKLTGTVTKKVGSDTIYVDGTKYTVAKQGTVSGSVAVSDEVEFYLDETGCIGYIKTTDATASVDTLAYVELTDTARGDYAVLRLADGTKKTVDTNKDYETYYGNDIENYIVKFSVTDAGDYKLTPLSAGPISTNDTTYTNGATATNTGIKVDSKTVFLYKTGTKYTQYVGKENAPSFATPSSAVAYTDTANRKAATFVYVEVNGSVSTDSSKLSVIAFKAGTKLTTEKDNVQYYEYKAIVNGEEGTIKVSAADRTNKLYGYRAEDGFSGFLALKASSIDTDGITSWVGEDELAQISNPTIKVEDDVLYIGNTGYAYTDDFVVYFVDNDDHSVSVGTIDDIVEDDNGEQNEYGSVSIKMNSNGSKLTAVVIAINE